MNKLVLRNVGRDFGGFAAVRDFSLDVATGEFVSLLGPSGCGKTTMLRMIAGFITPSRGTIELNGAPISSPTGSLPPEKRGMSMIFQSYAIWPNMTVAQNVAFGLKLRRLPAEEVKRRVADILDIVKLGALAGRYPAELSGGQQQRVALARAIVIKPEVLLLDEPLSNLDANLREEMRFEIRRLHDEFKMTTLYVTHDQSEAMVTSDRIVVMNQGAIEQVDTPFRLYNTPRTRFVASFIGRTNFLSARCVQDRIVFPGFSLPARHFDLAEGEQRLLSLRPQSIAISRAKPGEQPDSGIPGTVVSRAYSGDHWDYVIDPGGGNVVTVSTGPKLELQAGEAVFLTIDPENFSTILD